MIHVKNGETYAINNVEYKIGGKIVVTDDGSYSGLIGVITKICDGKDKETENESVDIYCNFEMPKIPYDRKQLIERFSALYGKTMTIEEINLDQVIMAPELIMPLENMCFNANTSDDSE